MPESQWVQSQLCYPVVKAFNTIRPASLARLGQPAGAAGRTVIPVAGDDPAAKSVVLELACKLGFDGLDACLLAESWRQQPGTPIYTTDLPLDAALQPGGRDPGADRQLAQPTPTAQQAGDSHAPKQPHRRALRPDQPVRPPPPPTSSVTGTTPTPRRSPPRATSPTTSTSRTPTPAARRPARATQRSTTSLPPTPRPPGQTPSTHPPTPRSCSLIRAPKLVSPELRASYALVGSQLQPGQHGPLTGIHVILSNGGDDTKRQHREAQILQTGPFYSAARFRLIEGSPEPAEWLEIFETDNPDPLHAYPRATSDTPPASQIQPQLSESFRPAGTRKTHGA